MVYSLYKNVTPSTSFEQTAKTFGNISPKKVMTSVPFLFFLSYDEVFPSKENKKNESQG